MKLTIEIEFTGIMLAKDVTVGDFLVLDASDRRAWLVLDRPERKEGIIEVAAIGNGECMFVSPGRTVAVGKVATFAKV